MQQENLRLSQSLTKLESSFVGVSSTRSSYCTSVVQAQVVSISILKEQEEISSQNDFEPLRHIETEPYIETQEDEDHRLECNDTVHAPLTQRAMHQTITFDYKP